MISITKQGNTTTYGVNEYVVDTDKEVNNILNAKAGSTAYSIESGNEYVKSQTGPWAIKGKGSGGSGNAELPDNLLYSFDMTEEEFWTNYNAGNLVDGLYAYDSDKKIGAILKETPELQSVSEPMLFNDTVWVFSYHNSGEIIQINDKGDFINKILIHDTYDYSTQFPCLTKTHPFYNSAVTIDNDGYIYLGGAGQTLSINTTKAQGNIIDQQDQDLTWLFRQYSYVDGKEFYEIPNWLSQSFVVKDGGTFGVLINESNTVANGIQHCIERVGYFKQGTQQFSSNDHPSGLDYLPNKNGTEFFTVDYDNNEFYGINLSYVGESSYTINLSCYNTQGTHNIYELPLTAEHIHDLSGQLFVKNHILYGHLIDNTNEMLYFFLFDTISKTVIQADVISVFVSGSFSTRITQQLNDICLYNNYAMLCLKEEGMTGEKLWFIKITYDDMPHIEILKREGAIINVPNIFSLACVNGIYMYTDSSNEVFGFDLINDRLYQYGVSVQEGVQFGQIKENELLITSYSYEGDQVNFVTVDLQTGNIINYIAYDDFENINSNMLGSRESLICFPEMEQFIYKGTVFDYNGQTFPRYLEKSQHTNEFLMRINSTDSVWLSNSGSSTVNYTLATGKVSTLVHKNHILFSKEFIE